MSTASMTMMLENSKRLFHDNAWIFYVDRWQIDEKSHLRELRALGRAAEQGRCRSVRIVSPCGGPCSGTGWADPCCEPPRYWPPPLQRLRAACPKGGMPQSGSL